MKRPAGENAVVDSMSAMLALKKPQLGAAVEADLRSIQKTIDQIEKECLRKQVEIQQEYAAKLKGPLEERDRHLKKVEGVWCALLRTFQVSEFEVFAPEDFEILRHLRSVTVDDNIDKEGSYRLHFIFDEEKVKDIFLPSVLTREVRFKPVEDDDSDAFEIEVTTTSITWKTKDTPIAAVAKRRASREGEKPKGARTNKESEDDETGDEGSGGKDDDDDDEDDDLDDQETSFFEWFENKKEDYPPLGEFIRRELYKNPLLVYDTFAWDDAADSKGPSTEA